MDLFSKTRIQRDQFDESLKNYSSYPNYSAKIISGIDKEISMLDFFIVDGEHILLSHVDASGVITLNRFLYIRSKQLAQIFASIFHECWDQSNI